MSIWLIVITTLTERTNERFLSTVWLVGDQLLLSFLTDTQCKFNFNINSGPNSNFFNKSNFVSRNTHSRNFQLNSQWKIVLSICIITLNVVHSLRAHTYTTERAIETKREQRQHRTVCDSIYLVSVCVDADDNDLTFMLMGNSQFIPATQRQHVRLIMPPSPGARFGSIRHGPMQSTTDSFLSIFSMQRKIGN